MAADPSFQEIIARAAERDPGAWTAIYERFSGPIFRFLTHQVADRGVAEDLTAGVFLEAIEAAPRFAGDESALRAWLFRIARHNLIDHFRRTRRSRTRPIEETGDEELARAGAEDPEESALRNLERGRVLAAIDKLSADQREVVLLRLAGGLTSSEIAGLLGKTTGAVKALQHRAMRALARHLEEKA